MRLAFAPPLLDASPRDTDVASSRARGDDALTKNFFRPLAPTHARERRSRLVPGASRDTPRADDRRLRTAAEALGAAGRPSSSVVIDTPFQTVHYE